MSVQRDSVRVSNLPFQSTWGDVKAFFQSNIGDVKQVTLEKNAQGLPKGCGTVQFSDPSSAALAVTKLNKTDFMGRPMYVDLEGGKSSSSGSYGSRKIYVVNLPFEMKWQEVKAIFRKEVGEVSHVTIHQNESGKSRGCGIIEFASAESAKKALQLKYLMLNDRKAHIQDFVEGERDQYGFLITSKKAEGFGDIINMAQNMNMAQNQPMEYGNTYGLSIPFLQSLGIEPGPLKTKLFIANLDPSVDEKKLRQIFRLAGKGLFVDLARDKEGKSRGFGFIEYSHPIEAVQAISMFHKQMLFGRELRVHVDSRPDEYQEDLPNSLPEGLMGVGMGLGPDGIPLTKVPSHLRAQYINNDGDMGNQMQGPGNGPMGPGMGPGMGPMEPGMGPMGPGMNQIPNEDVVTAVAAKTLAPAIALLASQLGLGANQGNNPSAGFNNRDGNMGQQFNQMQGQGFNDMPRDNMRQGFDNMPQQRFNDMPNNQRFNEMPRDNMQQRFNDMPQNNIQQRFNDMPQNNMQQRFNDMPQNNMQQRFNDMSQNNMQQGFNEGPRSQGGFNDMTRNGQGFGGDMGQGSNNFSRENQSQRFNDNFDQRFNNTSGGSGFNEMPRNNNAQHGFNEAPRNTNQGSMDRTPFGQDRPQNKPVGNFDKDFDPRGGNVVVSRSSSSQQGFGSSTAGRDQDRKWFNEQPLEDPFRSGSPKQEPISNFGQRSADSKVSGSGMSKAGGYGGGSLGSEKQKWASIAKSAENIGSGIAPKRPFDEEEATGMTADTWASRNKLASADNKNLGPVSNKMDSSALFSRASSDLGSHNSGAFPTAGRGVNQPEPTKFGQAKESVVKSAPPPPQLTTLSDTVMVSNLPDELTWEELGNNFMICGDVKTAIIKQPGTGLVRFNLARSAERALTFDKSVKWGRQINVCIF